MTLFDLYWGIHALLLFTLTSNALKLSLPESAPSQVLATIAEEYREHIDPQPQRFNQVIQFHFDLDELNPPAEYALCKETDVTRDTYRASYDRYVRDAKEKLKPITGTIRLSGDEKAPFPATLQSPFEANRNHTSRQQGGILREARTLGTLQLHVVAELPPADPEKEGGTHFGELIGSFTQSSQEKAKFSGQLRFIFDYQGRSCLLLFRIPNAEFNLEQANAPRHPTLIPEITFPPAPPLSQAEVEELEQIKRERKEALALRKERKEIQRQRENARAKRSQPPNVPPPPSPTSPPSTPASPQSPSNRRTDLDRFLNQLSPEEKARLAKWKEDSQKPIERAEEEDDSGCFENVVDTGSWSIFAVCLVLLLGRRMRLRSS